MLVIAISFGIAVTFYHGLSCGIAYGAQSELIADAPVQVQKVVQTYCVACHGPDKQKGKVRLDSLATLQGDARLDLLNAMHEAIRFEEMPPEDEKQPTQAERKLLDDWITSELKQAGPLKLEDKLRQPDAGNYLDHTKLFSGEFIDLKPFTYDRRWLISQFIFESKFNQILNYNPTRSVDGKRVNVIGDNNRRVNLTNPFLLPTHSGVRYYADETLNGGHLLTMLTNAKEASASVIEQATRNSRYLPAITDIMAMQWQHDRLLASRETYLNQFIDQLLHDLYKEKHESLLPRFTGISVTAAAPSTDPPTKKAPFHAANPGNQELELIYRTMQRLKREGESDQKLIQRCAQEWFNFGHHERKIEARITFLINYMEEFRGQIEQHRFAEKYKPIPFRPLPTEEMNAITQAILKHRAPGDHYNTIIHKCMTTWEQELRQTRIDAGLPSADRVAALVDQLFVKILERAPTSAELDQHVTLTQSYLQSMGNQKAIEKLIQTLILRSDFVYRNEFGQGEADEHGRRMLSPRDASYAIAYALTDSSPDAQLAEAARTGRLSSREDYRREVVRMLKKRDQYYIVDEAVERLQLTSSFTNMPIRELRFFREFLGYPNMLPIFKDDKRFGGRYDDAKGRLVGEADQLVEHILETDQRVFEQLLTTEDFYIYHSGDNEAMATYAARIARIYEYFKDKDWQNFELDDLIKHKAFLLEVSMRGIDANKLEPGKRYNPLNAFKTAMTSFTLRFDKGQTTAVPYDSFPAHGTSNASTRNGMQLRAPEVAKFFNIQLDNWNYPTTQPAKVANRKGMLTHPAWLIAHAGNTETDPVIRGKWIQEKLLAGTVPDLPITVDAVIPEDPHKTLRQRLDAKTGDQYCWNCHRKMNPLGLPFEIYDDFGRYRTMESLEYPENLIQKGPDKAPPHVDLRDIYKTLPVDSRGYLQGTGDEKLDAEVTDAIDMIDRLARSQRVRQSIIRHAFRYFMGRNEMLSDSRTLIDADRAYTESGGSFDAVIVSLLTSDSFIYRKPIE